MKSLFLLSILVISSLAQAGSIKIKVGDLAIDENKSLLLVTDVWEDEAVVTYTGGGLTWRVATNKLSPKVNSLRGLKSGDEAIYDKTPVRIAWVFENGQVAYHMGAYANTFFDSIENFSKKSSKRCIQGVCQNHQYTTQANKVIYVHSIYENGQITFTDGFYANLFVTDVETLLKQ